MNEQKNISEYGFNFQVKFIVCLITDKLFLEQIYDILDEKYLGNDAFKWLVKEIKEHYSKYKKVMTMDVFKVQVGGVDNDLLKQNVLDTLREVVKHLESEELDYIKDKALDFHKTQVLKDAILRSAQILEVDGDVEQIKVIVDDAMKAGMERDIGHDYLEDFEERYSETIVAKIRESDKDKLVTILVDSLAAASTKVEMDSDFDKDGWATAKAIVISKAMRKITQLIARQRVCLIFTNQLRQKLGVMFGDPWTTSGGKALPFHSSTRIRLKNTGQIKDKKNNTIGMKMRAQVIKNRLGPPMRHADFELYFETGIDDDGSWLKVMKDHKLVKQGGSWYTMNNHEDKEVKFQSKDWSELLKDEEFRSHCYDLICSKVILKYEKNFGIDDVVIEEEMSE